MDGAAGLGDERTHAQFGKHLGGRFHLGGAAHRVPPGAVDDPRHGAGVGRGKLGGDVLAQPLLVPRGPGGIERLHDRGGHALVKDAAQELLGRREPGRAVEHLDDGAERGQQARVPRGAVTAGEHGDAQAAPGHGRHHRHVGEGHSRGLADPGQLEFHSGCGGVQVGPHGVGPHSGEPRLEGINGRLGAVDAEHQVRPAGRLGLAADLGDARRHRRRRHGRVVPSDSRARGQQVAGDLRPGLAQAEHRDDPCHERGVSGATSAPSCPVPDCLK
jgi:hypothetical protein